MLKQVIGRISFWWSFELLLSFFSLVSNCLWRIDIIWRIGLGLCKTCETWQNFSPLFVIQSLPQLWHTLALTRLFESFNVILADLRSIMKSDYPNSKSMSSLSFIFGLGFFVKVNQTQVNYIEDIISSNYINRCVGQFKIFEERRVL